MMSLTLAVLVIAVSVLGNVNALSDDESKTIYAGLVPYVLECGKQYSVSEDQLKEAKEIGSIGAVNPCLLACVFKKVNLINDKGLFDPTKSEEATKKFLPNVEDQTKALNVINSCASVNDKDVSDGAEGCERAKLLFNCFIPFKGQFI